MTERKKGLVQGFRQCPDGYLASIIGDLDLGITLDQIKIMRGLCRSLNSDPTVGELYFWSAFCKKFAERTKNLPLTGASFPDSASAELFSRLLTEGKDRISRFSSGPSLTSAAAFAALGRSVPEAGTRFSIGLECEDVFQAFPGKKNAVFSAGGFTLAVSEGAADAKKIAGNTGLLIFPDEKTTVGAFIGRALPFASEIPEKHPGCRIVPCSSDGLFFDVVSSFPDAVLNVRELPGSNGLPEYSLEAFNPAFIVSCPPAEVGRIKDEAAAAGFGASVPVSPGSAGSGITVVSSEGVVRFPRSAATKLAISDERRLDLPFSPLAGEGELEVFSDSQGAVSAVCLSGEPYASLCETTSDSCAFALAGTLADDGAALPLILALDALRKNKAPKISAARFFPGEKTKIVVFRLGRECDAGKSFSPMPENGTFFSRLSGTDDLSSPAGLPDLSALPGRGKIYDGTAELCGCTPLLRAYPELPGVLLCKLELFNPAGSVKDRAALNIIRRAEAEGKLSSGSVIVEATSGNTGIGLAAYGCAAGYRVVIVMPDSMSRERIDLMRAYGAEVVLTPGTLGMSGAADEAKRIAANFPGSFIASQFDNPANPEAHFLSTGPELLRDSGGRIDFLVAGIGTGGTLCGTSKYLKQYLPELKAIACEPLSSPLISEGRTGKHGIQGIGPNFLPANYDPSVVDAVFRVSDEDAVGESRKFAKRYGILVGISSGCALFAAKKIASEEANRGKTVAVILPDTGEHYLSSGLFSGSAE